jgi:hypothetical protein
MNRGISPPSTSSSSTPTNNTSTSNSNHIHPHGQAHSRHKSKNGREKDPRWDLDTMETPNPGRSRSPLADEYTEPHWNSRTGTHSSSGQGYNSDRDGHGQRGMEVSESAGSFAGIGSGDYPSQSEEVEEERRIQDVSRGSSSALKAVSGELIQFCLQSTAVPCPLQSHHRPYDLYSPRPTSEPSLARGQGSRPSSSRPILESVRHPPIRWVRLYPIRSRSTRYGRLHVHLVRVCETSFGVVWRVGSQRAWVWQVGRCSGGAGWCEEGNQAASFGCESARHLNKQNVKISIADEFFPPCCFPFHSPTRPPHTANRSLNHPYLPRSRVHPPSAEVLPRSHVHRRQIPSNPTSTRCWRQTRRVPVRLGRNNRELTSNHEPGGTQRLDRHAQISLHRRHPARPSYKSLDRTLSWNVSYRPLRH